MTGDKLLCPRCQQPVNAHHLKANPECMQAAKSLHGMYMVAKRTTQGISTGRPVKLVPCPKCGEAVPTSVAKKGHGCQA